MTVKVGIRQSALSAAVFFGLLFALSSVDPRVRDQMASWTNGGVAPWSARLGDLFHALVSAAHHQSIENAPLLVFATVGVVLTIFMVKS
jgi:hypothetical protein